MTLIRIDKKGGLTVAMIATSATYQLDAPKTVAPVAVVRKPELPLN